MEVVATRRQAGFTAIELLMVVAIIGVVAAIIIPNMQRARVQAQVTTSKTNLRNLAVALEIFYADKGRYPPSLDDLATGGAYIRAVGSDPCTRRPYSESYQSDGGGDYLIRVNYMGTECNRVLPGIRYTPGGGLEEEASR